MFPRLFAIFLSLAVWLLAAAAFAGDGKFTPTEPPAPLPAFKFDDAKGYSMGIGDFKGRTVILNIWATWCSPCAAEMPSLNKLSKELDPDKFAVVAIAEDHDAVAAAQGFFQRHGIDNLKVYVDPYGDVPFALRARGLPTTLLIDSSGKEIARLEGGADWDSPAIKSYLKEKAR